MNINVETYNQFDGYLRHWLEQGVPDTIEANDNALSDAEYIAVARRLKSLTDEEWAAMWAASPRRYEYNRKTLRLLRQIERDCSFIW